MNAAKPKAMTRGESRRRRKKAADVCKISGVVVAVSHVDNEPPPEQLGRVHEASGGKGTPKRIRFRDTTPLELSHARAGITSRQLAAGDAFEALYRAASSVGGIRDSLDISPRGHGGEVTRRQIDIAGKWRDLSRALGICRCAVMVSVCIHWEPLRRLTAQQRDWLIEGLNVTGDFFGLACEDEATRER